MVDLTDLDMRARGVPYDEFARLRREDRVAWFAEPAPNSGFWSAHRYADTARKLTNYVLDQAEPTRTGGTRSAIARAPPRAPSCPT